MLRHGLLVRGDVGIADIAQDSILQVVMLVLGFGSPRTWRIVQMCRVCGFIDDLLIWLCEAGVRAPTTIFD